MAYSIHGAAPPWPPGVKAMAIKEQTASKPIAGAEPARDWVGGMGGHL